MKKISEIFYATVIYALFCHLSLVLNRWQHNRFSTEIYPKIFEMDMILIGLVSFAYIVYIYKLLSKE